MSQLRKKHVEIIKNPLYLTIQSLWIGSLSRLPMFIKDFVYLNAEIKLIRIQKKTSQVEFK